MKILKYRLYFCIPQLNFIILCYLYEGFAPKCYQYKTLAINYETTDNPLVLQAILVELQAAR